MDKKLNKLQKEIAGNFIEIFDCDTSNPNEFIKNAEKNRQMCIDTFDYLVNYVNKRLEINEEIYEILDSLDDVEIYNEIKETNRSKSKVYEIIHKYYYELYQLSRTEFKNGYTYINHPKWNEEFYEDIFEYLREKKPKEISCREIEKLFECFNSDLESID